MRTSAQHPARQEAFLSKPTTTAAAEAEEGRVSRVLERRKRALLAGRLCPSVSFLSGSLSLPSRRKEACLPTAKECPSFLRGQAALGGWVGVEGEREREVHKLNKCFTQS